MRYLSLRGDFGGFSGEIEFLPGLNILFARNEWGKSTLCAMIRAILYGIPSRGKEKDELIKYIPWSGKPMGGELLAEHGGRRVLISRSSAGAAAPMREFYAIYPETGEAVPGLDARNAGETLTGLPYEAFVRSVFFTGESVAVTKSDDLERKINSLASTGDEDISSIAVVKKLKDWQKERRSLRNTGRIPELERKISELDKKIAEVGEINAGVMALEEELFHGEARRGELSAMLLKIGEAENADRSLELKKMGEELLRAEAAAEAFRREKGLYGERADRALLESALAAARNADGREVELEIAQAERYKAELAAAEGPLPGEFSIFAGCTPEYIDEKAASDSADAREWLGAKNSPARFIAAGALLLLAGSLFVLPIEDFAIKLVFALMLGIGGAALLFLGLRARREARENRAAANELLLAYGAKRPEEFLSLAVRYKHHVEEVMLRRARADEKAAAAEDAADRLAFAGGAAQGYAERLGLVPGRGLSAALTELWRDANTLFELESRARLARAVYEPALAAAREQGWENAQAPREELPEREKTERELAGLDAGLEDCRARLHQSRGRLSGLPDLSELKSERLELSEELSLRNFELAAIETAVWAAEESGQELSSRLTPKLTAEAAEIFSELTGNKYEKLILTKDFDAKVAEPGGALRPAEALSRGAGDQLYLAVRMALAKVLAEQENPPMVLDDALLSFDDERAGKALEWLGREAGSRQVLLLTCRERDAALAPPEANIIRMP